jgi:allantoinase
MKTHPSKVLINALISVGENRLQLVDIYFNSHIERIEATLDSEIDWLDISDKESWESFKEEIPEQKFPPQLNIYDGKFLLLMPGAIDTHVHFNTPGFEFRETFETGSLAAAFGGVTTVADMPCTSKPPVTNSENFKAKVETISGRSYIDYGFWGGVRGNDFKDHKFIKHQIEQLDKCGVIGFKAYLSSGMKTFLELSPNEMAYTAKCIHRTGKPLAVHAEDKIYIAHKKNRYQTMGQNDWRAYCDARDDLAEAKAVFHMVDISQKTDCWIHIVHLSSALGLEMVRKAQLEGLNITAETCPHYLYFTQNDFENEAISNFLKTAPPVKNEQDKHALWDGLQDGSISMVTTDHAGCDPKREKSSWNFWEVYGGIPGVEHRVPFLFSEGFKKGRLNLARTIDLLSTNPANFADFCDKGSLDEGKDADMTLVNLWDKQVIKADGMHSKGKYTPFEDVEFETKVERTFLRGKVLMDDDDKPETEIGYGKLVTV